MTTITPYYVLDENGEPTPEPDQEKWNEFMVNADRRIALDRVGEIDISTVFRGIDTSLGRGAPVLWETMVFGGPLHEQCAQYTSQQTALEGHEAMVKRVKETFQ